MLFRSKAELEAAQAGLTEGSGSDTQITEAQNALKQAIEAAKPLIEAGKKNYTDKSWEAFEFAYDTARAGETSTSVTTLTRLKTELETAQKNLEESDDNDVKKQLEAARDELLAVIELAEPIFDEGMKNYTTSSWEEFESAYTSSLNAFRASVTCASEPDPDDSVRFFLASANSVFNLVKVVTLVEVKPALAAS